MSFGYCIAMSETETRQTHVKFVLDLEEVHTMDKSNTKRFEVKFVLDLEEVPPAGIFFWKRFRQLARQQTLPNQV